MKIISWNVNGLKAIMCKIDFEKFISDENPDVICLQETKCNPANITFNNYNVFCSVCSTNKGYAGTAILSKIPATQITSPVDDDGRITAIEINDYIIISVYVPNSQRNLEKLEYRLKWDQQFRNWLTSLPKNKKYIICGDFNVSHTELDIAEPKKHHHHPGFTNEERKSFEILLNNYIDVYRHKNPNSRDYSFWSYHGKNYERNIGYRCDLFLIKKDMMNEHIDIDIMIMKSTRFSDHCPVALTINDS